MIKRSVNIILEESHSKMMGFVGMEGYYLSQLCVKHEAASLLPLEIELYGKKYKFEEVARVLYGEGEENDDKMSVYPNDMEYLGALVEAIHKVHPEFKQELIDPNENEDESPEPSTTSKASSFGSTSAMPSSDDVEEKSDDGKYYFILLTMPPVTKELRDTYLNSVKAIYDYCKLRIDGEKVKLAANVATKVIGYTKADAEECKQAVDKVYDKNKEFLDTLREEKEKEIEEGYQRYLKNQGGQNNSSSSQDSSASDGSRKADAQSGQSMRL